MFSCIDVHCKLKHLKTVTRHRQIALEYKYRTACRVVGLKDSSLNLKALNVLLQKELYRVILYWEKLDRKSHQRYVNGHRMWKINKSGYPSLSSCPSLRRFCTFNSISSGFLSATLFANQRLANGVLKPLCFL